MTTPMKLHPLPWLLSSALLGVLVACGGGESEDAGNGSAADAGLDGSGTVDPACQGTAPPVENAACDCEATEGSFSSGLCDYACECTGGFWGCTETCEEPVEVVLEWGVDPGVLEQDGNGNNVPNPGETWTVTGSVVRTNATDTVPITVQLRTDSTRLLIEEPSVTLDDVGGEEVEFEIPFDIADAASDGTAVLTIEAFTEDGFTVIEDTLELTVATVPTAILSFTGEDFVERTGNGNSFRDAGEEWTLQITLRNTGDAPAEGLAVAASASSTSLEAVSVEPVAATLNGGGQLPVEVLFRIADEPTDLEPQLQLSVTASNATTGTANVPVAVRPPDTLQLAETRIEQVPGFGNDDTNVDDGETWQVALVIENTGGFDVEGLTWNLLNYTPTPIPDGSGSGTEEPPYVDLQFGLADTPTRIAAGASVELLAQAAIEASTGSLGRIIVSASSTLRRHGPFAFDVTWTRP